MTTIEEYEDLEKYFETLPFHLPRKNIVEMDFPNPNSPEAKEKFVRVYTTGIEEIITKIAKPRTLHFGNKSHEFMECHNGHDIPVLLVKLFYDEKKFSMSFILQKSDLYVLAFTSDKVFYEIREKRQSKERVVQNFPKCGMKLSRAYSVTSKKFMGSDICDTILHFSVKFKDISVGKSSQEHIEIIFWYFAGASRFCCILEETSKYFCCILEETSKYLEGDWNEEHQPSPVSQKIVNFWSKTSRALRGGGAAIQHIKENDIIKQSYEVRNLVSSCDKRKKHWASFVPGLKDNIRLLNEEQEDLAKKLWEEDQGHLFESWPKEGDNDNLKCELFLQVTRLDASYQVDLLSFLKQARKYMTDRKDPFDGFIPYGKVERLDYHDNKPWLAIDEYKIQVLPIRNVCILPEEDHAKRIADHLTMPYGGGVPYLIEDVKRHALLYDYKSIFLIDSPQLSDGAIILVDVMEGVKPEIHSALHQVWTAKLAWCLILNNVEQLLNLNCEFQKNTEEAYEKLNMILRQVNKICRDYESEGDDDFFQPNKGNVVFASAAHEWGFGISSCIQFLAPKMKDIATELQWVSK